MGRVIIFLSKLIPLKLDIHVHTSNSGDSNIKVESVPAAMRIKGLDGIALTEHNRLMKYHLDGVIVVPGVEISTSEGHLLALGIKENIESKMSMAETIKEVKVQDGVAIIAHPYSFSARAKVKHLSIKPNAIEVLNARNLFCYISVKLAKRMAKKLSLPTTGGSDSHIVDTIGDAYTIVYARSKSINDILEAFRLGNVEASGRCSSLKNKVKGRMRSITKKLKHL